MLSLAVQFCPGDGERTSTALLASGVGFAPSAGCEVLLQQNHLRAQWDTKTLGQKDLKGHCGHLAQQVRTPLDQKSEAWVSAVALPLGSPTHLAVWPWENPA